MNNVMHVLVSGSPLSSGKLDDNNNNKSSCTTRQPRCKSLISSNSKHPQNLREGLLPSHRPRSSYTHIACRRSSVSSFIFTKTILTLVLLLAVVCVFILNGHSKASSVTQQCAFLSPFRATSPRIPVIIIITHALATPTSTADPSSSTTFCSEEERFFRLNSSFRFTLALGSPTLLSGSISACLPNASVSTCKGGLASFLAYGRNLTSRVDARRAEFENESGGGGGMSIHNRNFTDLLITLPQIDVSTPFVQMHPHGLAVNLDVYRRGGVSTFLAYPSFYTQTIDYSHFYDSVDVSPLAANLEPPTGNRWRHRIKPFIIYKVPFRGIIRTEQSLENSTINNGTYLACDNTTNSNFSAFASLLLPPLYDDVSICVTRTVQAGQTWVSDPVKALIALMQDMRLVCEIVVVVGGDINYPYTRLLPLLNGHVPDVFIDTSTSATSMKGPSGGLSAYTSPGANRTTLVGAVSVSSQGSFVSIEVLRQLRANSNFSSIQLSGGDLSASTTLSPSTTSDLFTTTINNTYFWSPTIDSLPSTLKDKAYYTLQEFLVANAKLATTNDPILTNTLASVPKSRLDNSYPCFGGECAQGTLYVAAYRWRYDTDIGFTNSGGVRGPGWPAGPVRTSDVWGLMPFVNYPCTGRILGLKVWELFNISMHYCTFSDAYSATGSSYQQSSGVRIEYDRSPLSEQAHTRVRAIYIQNKTTGAYEPLERLRYYTFVTDQYQCQNGVVAPLLTNAYTGESYKLDVSEELVQTTIQEFLKAHVPYDPVFTNVLVENNATSAETDFMLWTRTSKDCDPLKEYYNFGLRTCQSCGLGEQQDPHDPTRCVEDPPEDSRSLSSSNDALTAWLIPVVVVLAVVFIVIALAFLLFFLVFKRSGVRNTDNAPKGNTAAIIFTDIQMSTKLWGTVPAAMGHALDQHHALIRTAIAKHKAYEVKTVGDSFMIACHNASQAAELAMGVQLMFMNAKWPRCLNYVYAAESNTDDDYGGVNGDDDDDLFDDDPEDLTDVGIEECDDDTTVADEMIPLAPGGGKKQQEGKKAATAQPKAGGKEVAIIMSKDGKPAPAVSKLFNGLRVRIGIHFGPVEAIFDEVAKGYDYYGNTVNVASRIESAGDGGQILVSRDVANKIPPDDARYRLELLGEFSLKGVVEMTELLQLSPICLIGRVFTANSQLTRAGDNNEKGKAGGGDASGMGTAPPTEFSLSDKSVVEGQHNASYNIAHQQRAGRSRNYLGGAAAAGDTQSFMGSVGESLFAAANNSNNNINDPLSAEWEKEVRELIGRVFKPLPKDIKKKQIEQIAAAWRVQFPANFPDLLTAVSPANTTNKKGALDTQRFDHTIAIVTRRVCATSNFLKQQKQQHQQQNQRHSLSLHNNSAKGNTNNDGNNNNNNKNTDALSKMSPSISTLKSPTGIDGLPLGDMNNNHDGETAHHQTMPFSLESSRVALPIHAGAENSAASPHVPQANTK